MPYYYTSRVSGCGAIAGLVCGIVFASSGGLGIVGSVIFIWATVSAGFAVGMLVGACVDIARSCCSVKDPEAELEKKLKQTYDEIKKVMDSEPNDENKETKIKKILFESFASQYRIITNKQQFDDLMRLEVDSIENKPESKQFKDKEILKLMQEYCRAVVEAEDGSLLVYTFVQDFGKQTVAGREGQRNPASSASVSAGAGVSIKDSSLLLG